MPNCASSARVLFKVYTPRSQSTWDLPILVGQITMISKNNSDLEAALGSDSVSQVSSTILINE